MSILVLAKSFCSCLDVSNLNYDLSKLNLVLNCIFYQFRINRGSAKKTVAVPFGQQVGLEVILLVTRIEHETVEMLSM